MLTRTTVLLKILVWLPMAIASQAPAIALPNLPSHSIDSLLLSTVSTAGGSAADSAETDSAETDSAETDSAAGLWWIIPLLIGVPLLIWLWKGRKPLQRHQVSESSVAVLSDSEAVASEFVSSETSSQKTVTSETAALETGYPEAVASEAISAEAIASDPISTPASEPEVATLASAPAPAADSLSATESPFDRALEPVEPPLDLADNDVSNTDIQLSNPSPATSGSDSRPSDLGDDAATDPLAPETTSAELLPVVPEPAAMMSRATTEPVNHLADSSVTDSSVTDSSVTDSSVTDSFVDDSSISNEPADSSVGNSSVGDEPADSSAGDDSKQTQPIVLDCVDELPEPLSATLPTPSVDAGIPPGENALLHDTELADFSPTLNDELGSAAQPALSPTDHELEDDGQPGDIDTDQASDASLQNRVDPLMGDNLAVAATAEPMLLSEGSEQNELVDAGLASSIESGEADAHAAPESQLESQPESIVDSALTSDGDSVSEGSETDSEPAIHELTSSDDGLLSGADLSIELTLTPQAQGDMMIQLAMSDDARAALQQSEVLLMLRLYDATAIELDIQSPHSVQAYRVDPYDLEVQFSAPMGDRDYVAELGYETPAGVWACLGRSLHARVPAVQPPDLKPPKRLVSPTLEYEAPTYTALSFVHATEQPSATEQLSISVVDLPLASAAAMPAAAAEAAETMDLATSELTEPLPIDDESEENESDAVTATDHVLPEPVENGADAVDDATPSPLDADLRDATALADTTHLPSSCDALAEIDLPAGASLLEPDAIPRPAEKTVANLDPQPVDEVRSLMPRMSLSFQQTRGKTSLTIHSREHCYPLRHTDMQAVQSPLNTTVLAAGTYIVCLETMPLGDRPDHPVDAESWVLLWLYGGRFVNQQTQIESQNTWVSLHGFSDALTLNVIEPMTLCAVFLAPPGGNLVRQAKVLIVKDE